MNVEILTVLHASPVSAVSSAAGPRRLVEAGLGDILTSAGHDVRIREVACPTADGTGAIGREFAVASEISERVRAARARERMPIVLSGSCHAAVGCVAGLDLDRPGIVWLDAHADFNTPETTQSGLLDGMVLATITGRCWSGLRSSVPGSIPLADSAILMVGLRALDPGEASLLDDADIRRLPPEADGGELDAALASLAEHVDGVYAHLDLDVLDLSEGRANAYAAEGGLSRAELGRTLAAVERICGIGVLTLASYDPEVDPEGRVCRAAVDAVEAADLG